MEASPPRRVVTGHDSSGRSVVLSDGATPTSEEFPTGATFHEIWATAAEPVPVDDDELSEPTARPLQVPPDANGTIVHVIDMPPGSSAPMHRTETVDYGIVLSGEIDLELDDGSTLHLGPGDIVVQRATAHAWHNRTQQVTRLLFVMVDAKLSDELASTLGEAALAEILH